MVDWETQDQFWIHNNARVGLQRITLLGFKFDLRFLRILKLLHIYSFGVLFIYFLYPYFILGQYSFFISEYRSIERDHWPEIYSGTSSFLIQILKKISIYFEDDYQIELIVPAKSSRECMTSLIKKHEWILFSKVSTSKQSFLKISKTHRKKPVVEFLYNKLQAKNLALYWKRLNACVFQWNLRNF